jgi:hypothetical protein
MRDRIFIFAYLFLWVIHGARIFVKSEDFGIKLSTIAFFFGAGILLHRVASPK